MQFSPKIPNVINGNTVRLQNAASIRSKLGLGTMAQQNEYSVYISGGYINVSTLYSTYIYGTYTTTTDLVVNGKMNRHPTVHNTSGQIADSELVVLVDASAASGTCSHG